MEEDVHVEEAKEAESVWLLMGKEYRISRSIRLQWFFHHLYKVVVPKADEDIVSTCQASKQVFNSVGSNCSKSIIKTLVYPPWIFFLSPHWIGLKKMLACCHLTLNKTVELLGWKKIIWSGCPICFALIVMFLTVFKTDVLNRQIKKILY